jgi:subtilisin family serine protease
VAAGCTVLAGADAHPARDGARPSHGRAPSGRAPQDADGHGTHCAGTVGAVANNALGVAGVAGGVRLLGCKAIAGLDGHLVTSAAVRCLEYCAAAGAHITSNSWGGQARGARSEVPLCTPVRPARRLRASRSSPGAAGARRLRSGLAGECR